MALGDPPDYSSLLGAVGAAPDMWKYINTDETIKQIMAQPNPNAQVQQYEPRVPIAVQVRQRQVIRAKELFVNRMKGVRGNFTLKDTDFVETHIHSDTVIMFYCFDGRDGIVREPIDVWPSDTLIAQFRMVLA